MPEVVAVKIIFVPAQFETVELEVMLTDCAFKSTFNENRGNNMVNNFLIL
jgi:hypothetical protein